MGKFHGSSHHQAANYQPLTADQNRQQPTSSTSHRLLQCRRLSRCLLPRQIRGCLLDRGDDVPEVMDKNMKKNKVSTFEKLKDQLSWCWKCHLKPEKDWKGRALPRLPSKTEDSDPRK